MYYSKSPITKTLSALVVIYLVMGTSILSSACIVFNKSSGDKVLFGNVENEAPHYVSELHFVPPDEAVGPYGHFYIYYNGNIGGGMNDQGLCFDVAGLPPHNAFTGQPHGDLMSHLLNNCATVNEAIGFFSNYYWPGHNVNHLMVMDKTGASVIVELIGSSYYMFYKEGEGQVMTNYSIADPEIRYGDYPCSRYITANEMLDTANITIEHFQKISEKVSHAYYDALYANVYNPNTLDIHFFNANLNGGERTTFNLIHEYNKGSHHYILKNNQIILDLPENAAADFSISDNMPNPFSESTSFMLTLERDVTVVVNISDLHGRLVSSLEKDSKNPGNYSYTWNASSYPGGIYICRFNIDGIIETRKWLKIYK